MSKLKLWTPILVGVTILFTLSLITQSKSRVLSLPTSKTLIDTFEQVQSLAENSQPLKPRTTFVTFLAVGDISLSRGIAYSIQKNNDTLFPFRRIDALLKSTDFNFGNLETPFSSSDVFTPKSTLVFNAPKKNIAGLKKYNFEVLSLANNHALDQKIDGIKTTIKMLDTNGLLHAGTAENLEEAWQPAIIEKNGIKIGFIAASYASVNDGGKTTNNHVARIEDTEHLKSAIYNLKSTIDFSVVSMHAGTEYTRKPNQTQIDFAHAAIDAGADMIIGHHPHWVQNKEVYCPNNKGSREILFNETLELTPEETGFGCKPVYYSLGNFIFDQSWSEETKKGLALKITLRKTGLCHPNLDGDIYLYAQSNNQVDVLASAEITDRSMVITNNDCGPQLQGPRPTTTLESIEETPIKIEDSCCPIRDEK